LNDAFNERKFDWTYGRPFLMPDTAKLILAGNIVYHLVTNITKASIITQYLRLFHEPTMRRLCHTTYILLFLAAAWGVLGGTFVCTPVRKFWDLSVEGSCWSASNYWVSAAAVSVAMDFWVWMLPMPVIGKLRLGKRQMWGVVAVFALGGIVCAVSVVRLVLVKVLEGINMTRSGVAAVTWSAIEANVGIICASLMALKPLVMRMFPTLMADPKPPRHAMSLPMIHQTIDKGGQSEDSWGSHTNTGCQLDKGQSVVTCEATDADPLTLLDLSRWIFDGGDAPRSPLYISITKEVEVKSDVRRPGDSLSRCRSTRDSVTRPMSARGAGRILPRTLSAPSSLRVDEASPRRST